MSIIYSILTSMLLSLNLLQQAPFSGIKQAFDQQSAQSLVNLCQDKVQLNLEGKSGLYGKKQGLLIIQHFFSVNPEGKFTYRQKSEDSSTASAIASYQQKDKSFKVAIKLRKSGNLCVIESLTIY